MRMILSLVAISCSLAASAHAGEPLVVDVWPGQAPGGEPLKGPERNQPNPNPVQLLTDVSKPTLTVLRPAKEKDTGAAVVICPGGAYRILAWDLEGTEVAAWLNEIGVTAIILKYRVPTREGETRGTYPLKDAQRALSLVRSKATEWGIDPERIGILGFSAGGHLSANASTNSDRRSYEAIDAVDEVSCRPDFAILIYPAYLTKDGTAELQPEIRATDKAPPTFLVHAIDDPVGPESSIGLALALKKAKVPVEMHIYDAGGHGFGLRPSEHPCSRWPERCAEWMKSRGLLKGK